MMASELNPYQAPESDPVEKPSFRLDDLSPLLAQMSYPLCFTFRHNLPPMLDVTDSMGRAIACVTRKTMKLDSIHIYQDKTYRDYLGEVKRKSFTMSKMASILCPNQSQVGWVKRRSFLFCPATYEIVKAEDEKVSYTLEEVSFLAKTISNSFGRLWGIGRYIRSFFKARLQITDTQKKVVMSLDYDEEDRQLYLKMNEEIPLEDQYMVILSLIDLILISRIRI